MNICVFASSSVSLDEIYYKKAYEFGKLMAENSHRLIFGGGKEGLMGSCSRGILENNGEAIGIAPKIFDKPGILEEECQQLILTDSMAERKNLMVDMADSFVALPGGIGTYEELLEVMTLKQLGQINKPIIIYNVNGYYDILSKLLDDTINKGFMKKEAKIIYSIENNPLEILKKIGEEIKNPYDVKHLKNI